MSDLNFNKLKKLELDFNILKENSYFGTIIKISILDNDKQGSNFYTLFNGDNIGMNSSKYYIQHSWARGWDQWGYDYELAEEELIDFIKENDNGHIFIEAIKQYLGEFKFK